MRSSHLGAVVGALICLLTTSCTEPTAGTGTALSTAGTPSPSPSPEIDPVDAALADLDRREQVAQLIVVGVALTDLSPADEYAAEGLGGVFLQGRSSIPADELATKTARWAQAAPVRGPGSASTRRAAPSRRSPARASPTSRRPSARAACQRRSWPPSPMTWVHR